MNELIDDLGITNGKRYYSVKCYDCSTVITIRADRSKQIARCKPCQMVERSRKAQVAAAAVTKLTDTKVCTCCGLTKHIYDFHKKHSQISGTRAVCKACRYFAERSNNIAYSKSENGKLVTLNNQGKRRERMYSSSDGTITKDALKTLKENQNHKCYYCDCALDYTVPKQVHLDHIIPLSKGGTHTIGNVVWACCSCNSSKSNKLLE